MPDMRVVGFLGRTNERRHIDDALTNARDGRSAILVIRGEAGIGKSALLRYAARQATVFRVAHVEGVQAEMELPFSGIHSLCAPLFDAMPELPEPQQKALRVALGISSGDAPDKFLVAVAVLALLAANAAKRPLLCLVDDAQWLDATSLGALGFVARRLVADAVAMIFVLREPATAPALDGLPRLSVEGLDEPDARALLSLAVPGRLDERVRDRIIGETRGNPLALLDLSQTMSPAERAGGFEPPTSGDLGGQLSQEYQRRIAELCKPTQLLMLLAAAEPLGDAALLWRAADRLSIEPGALTQAAEAGLLDVDDHVRFRHPLVRAAAYQAASVDERRRAHRALAEASDPERAADSRAWHRAFAATGPDEAVAADLERTARRVARHGGLAAAAALLERATALTPGPAIQAGRSLDAAEASFQAGDFHATQRLLATALSGSLDDFQRARAGLLRGRVTVVSRHRNDGAELILEAARQLASFDVSLARRAYSSAWSAAITAHHFGRPGVLLDVSRAILALPPLSADPHPLDLVANGLALLIIQGPLAARSILQRAAKEVLRLPVEDVLRGGWQVGGVASAIWDDEAIVIFERDVQLVREAGALAELPLHLHALAFERAWRGDLLEARGAVAEGDQIAASTGIPVPPFAMLRILALEGREAEAVPLIDAIIQEGTKQGQGSAVMSAHWASAVLNNGLGRHRQAIGPAREVVSNGILPWLSMWGRCELVEAAARVGDVELAQDALAGLVATTRPASSHLARGIEARSRALLAADDAEELHRDAISELDRSGNRTELARAYLVFGEWLHRQDRRREAREPLQTAEQMFAEIGMEAFAQRARDAVVAVGAKPRTRAAETSADLTPQEGQIARLARDGLTNVQIGVQLFLSPRTVEWHLHNAFAKLRIESRDGLDGALPPEQRARPSLLKT